MSPTMSQPVGELDIRIDGDDVALAGDREALIAFADQVRVLAKSDRNGAHDHFRQGSATLTVYLSRP